MVDKMKKPLEKRVYAFQEKHSDKADSFTAKHFQEKCAPRSTFDTISRREENVSKRTLTQKEKIHRLSKQLYLKYKHFEPNFSLTNSEINGDNHLYFNTKRSKIQNKKQI